MKSGVCSVRPAHVRDFPERTYWLFNSIVSGLSETRFAARKRR